MSAITQLMLLGATYRDALRTVQARHDRLRSIAPARFSTTPEEYWAGFPASRRRASPEKTAPAPVTARAAPSSSKSGGGQAPKRRVSGRRKGARRIVVDGEVYFWRVPRRSNADQHDLHHSVFALVQHEDGGRELALYFPQPHPAEAIAPPKPVLPSDVANAIRELRKTGAYPSPLLTREALLK